MPHSRWSLTLVVMLVVSGCGSPQRSSTQPPPLVDVAVALPPLPSTQVACFDRTYFRGLIIQQATDGHPVIRVGLFRAVNQDDAGAITFDLETIAKLEGKIEGNSDARDYVLNMKAQAHTEAPKVELHGVYKLVQVLDGEVTYADLVETPWNCGATQETFDNLKWGNDMSTSTCRDGTSTVTFSSLDEPYSDLAVRMKCALRAPNDWRLLEHTPLDPTCLAKVHAELEQTYNEALKRRQAKRDQCDPTGHLAAVFQPNPRYEYNYDIFTFSLSTSPLYPAPDFYNKWEAGSGLGEWKAAFQISWLIAKQRWRSTGK